MHKTYLNLVAGIIRVWGWKNITSFVIATMIPTLIFTGVALNRPISFDGAMNLQVAQNVADHGQYVRNYARQKNFDSEKTTNTSVFPNEVETNGPYILTAALGIKLFGENQFAYQFANLVFIFGVAVVSWWMLRRWTVVATVAPTIILLLMPATFDATLGGYGEMPAIFFALLAVAFVAHSVTQKDKTTVLKYITLAFVTAGAAILTKTYLVGFVPAMLLGVLAVKFAKNISIKPLFYRSLYILLLPIIHEIWHLFSRGSVSEYLVWWKSQIKAILLQSGLRDTAVVTSDKPSSILEKIGTQSDILFSYTSIGLIVILITIGITVSLYLGYFHKHNNNIAKIRKIINTKHGLLILMLGVMFATYFIWWLVLLPEAKTFIRRTLPIMLPLEIVLAMLIAVGTSVFSMSKLRINLSIIMKKGRICATGFVMFLGLIITLITFLIAPLNNAIEKTQTKPFLTISDYEDTVNVLKSAPDGGRIYGLGWWSAPVVDLMSEREFHNLALVKPCNVDSEKDIVVWDKIASGITKSKTPYKKAYEYKLYADTRAAKLYTLEPVEKCKH